MPAGAPQHEPTEWTRDTVANAALAGIPINKIAKALGLSKNTLRKHYEQELKAGIVKTLADSAGFLANMATGRAIDEGATHADCLRAGMFLFKCRGGWSEKQEDQEGQKQGAPVTIILADAVPPGEEKE
jgi:hypothetical protein